MSSQEKAAKRRKLYLEQDGKCHWCDKPMFCPEVYPVCSGEPLRKDLCTLDHLFDRTHPLRLYPSPGQQRYVAACLECNNDRGRVTCALSLQRANSERRAQ